MSGYVSDLHSLLKEGSLAERKAFVRSFVREIKVTCDEVIMNYNIPLLPDNITVGKERVLPTVQYGGQ